MVMVVSKLAMLPVWTTFFALSTSGFIPLRSSPRSWPLMSTPLDLVGSAAPFPLFDTSRSLLGESNARSISPIQLAFIGDAVFELHARVLFAWPTSKAQVHRSSVVKLVRAEAQAVLLRRLILSRWPLSALERTLLRQGRNAAGPAPQRLSGSEYGEATGLETLIGYLYLTDKQRLQALLDQLLLLGGSSHKFTAGDDLPVDWKAMSEIDVGLTPNLKTEAAALEDKP